jgi:hypothetical protein
VIESQAPSAHTNSTFGDIAAWWGILGVVAFLGFAVFRLLPYALELTSYPLTWFHSLMIVISIVFMAHSEGYRGFQRSFSPRVARRAADLRAAPTALNALFAPIYCMGFYAASRRVMYTVYAITTIIVILVLIMRTVEQPWRGIIDAGVVVGLSWGTIATLLLGMQAMRSPAMQPAEEPTGVVIAPRLTHQTHL